MTERAVTFTARMVNRTTPQVNEVVQGMDRMRVATERVTRVTGAAANVNQSWMRGMSQNRRIVQQLGFQMTDFTTQVAGGQSALLAFIQQGGQTLQFFGATGAVLATLLTVFGTMGLVFLRSGQSMAALTPILGVLNDEFRSIASAVRAVGSFMIDVANVVLNNLDTILVSATLVGMYFAIGWVAAMVRAQAAAIGLATATVRLAAMQRLAMVASREFASVIWLATLNLNYFRAAIIAGISATIAFMSAAVMSTLGFVRALFTLRGAITAVYVLMMGPLIEALARFIAVVTVGAVSAVLSLYVAFLRLSGVAIMAVVSAMSMGMAATMRFAAALTWTNIQAAALTATAAVLRGVMVVWATVTSAVAVAKTALSTAVTIAKSSVLALAGAFRVLMFAIAALGIGALVIGVGALITGFMRAKEVLGSWPAVLALVKDVAVAMFDRILMSFAMIPLAVKAGSANMAAWFLEKVETMWNGFQSLTEGVAGAFDSLFGTDLTGRLAGVGASISGMATGLRESAAESYGHMLTLRDAITAPIDALDRLRDAMSDDSTFDVRDWFGGGNGDEAASGAQRTADRIADIYKQTARSISDAFKSAFKGLIDGSKSATDVVREMLGSILDRIYDIMMTPVFDNIARMVTGGIFRLTGTPMPTTIPSFAGGGQTRAGVRAGGVDGKGGTLAIMHPNETIVDETVRAGGRGGIGATTSVQNIVNNYGSEPVTQETQRGPDGELLLITTIGRAIAQGKLDGALSSRMNTKPRTITR